MQRRPSLLAATLVTAAICFASPVPAQDFYAGKTLRVVVGLQSGGSADAFVRGFTGHLRKHLPGNPNVIIQNVTGAGGNAAINYLSERADKDGLTILFSPYHPLAQAFAGAGFRARYDDFELLGGVGDIRVNYVRSDAVPGGVREPRDIMKADSMIVGALSGTDFSGTLSVLSLKVLGVKHRVVLGYRGGAEIFLAMQRGEIQFHNTSIGSFRQRSGEFIKSGVGIGVSYLVSVGADGQFERSTFINEMPSFPDLYRDIHGKPPSGPDWEAFNWLTTQTGDVTYVALAPRGTAPEALKVLRTGFERVARDPDYINETIKRSGAPYRFVDVQRGQAVFRELAEVSPRVLDTLREVIGQK
jgi:tripartite-type tricarboxylate transporter receptor subunit TctC